MRCSDLLPSLAARSAPAALVVALAGCGASNIGLELRVDPPRLDALSPPSGVAGERVSVVVSGRALHPRVVQDLGSVGGVQVEAGFSAWLGEVPLEHVAWIDETRLEAVVPAALAAGRYDLRVRTPNGLEASLANAYRALDPDPPLDVVLLPQPEVTSVGGVIGVRVRVTNRGSADVLDVEAQELASVPEGVAALTAGGGSAPVSLSPGASAELVFTFVATAPGLVSFRAGAAGFDTFGNVVETAAPATSAAVTVQRAAGVSVTLAAEPATVVAGALLTLAVTVTNDGETGAGGVSPALLHDGALLSVLEGPTPSAADVPGGESVTFTFTARADASGTGLVTASASGNDVLSGDPVAGPPSTALVTAVDPPALTGRWSAPDRVSLGQPFAAVLEITNTGGSGVVDVVAALSDDTSGAVACGAPSPPVVPSLGALERATFSYECVAADVAGALVLAASATASRAVDGVLVPPALFSSPAVVVERPPQLSLAWSEPSGAASGRRYAVALTVTNTGDATALHVEVDDFVVEGGTGTLCGAEAASHLELAGGASHTFLFDCAAGPRAGLARTAATVSSEDVNSGANVVSSGRSLGVEVRASAPLAVLLNEVITDPRHDWSDSDGAGEPFDHVPGHGLVDEGDEWLELYNAGTAPVDLRGLVLTLADATPTSLVLGASESPLLRFSDGGDLAHFAPGEHLVIGAPGGESGMDDDVWITLDTPEGLRVDEVALGAGLGGPENLAYNAPSGGSVDEGGSIARLPAGSDTAFDAADFTRAVITIGRHNDCEVRSSLLAAAATSATTDTPPLSFPYVASGDDAVLVVGVAARAQVTAVSYAGLALEHVGGALGEGASLWVLSAPPEGEASVVVQASPGKLAAGALLLTGAQQVYPFGAVALGQGNTSAPTLAVDVPVAGSVVVDAICVRQSVVATPSGAQALAWREVGGVGGGVGGGSSTHGPLPTAGSTTLAWSLDSNGPWSWVAASFPGQCQ